MKLLLDTNVVLWLMGASSRLTPRSVSLIQNAEEVYVSSASIWEIAIKWRIGKIEENPQLIVDLLEKAGLRNLEVTNRHAVATGSLPLIHQDPFDRILVAQAISETMRLLTADSRLAAYSELVVMV